MEIAQQMPVCLDIKDLFANAGNVLIPRKIYLYSFPDNKSMREAFEDEDFIAQNPKLAELYESMYTNSDLIEILNMPTTQMGEYIKALPVGCKNAIKGVAATMIDNGSLDSVQKIKVLDEIFGTNMLLTLIKE